VRLYITTVAGAVHCISGTVGVIWGKMTLPDFLREVLGEVPGKSLGSAWEVPGKCLGSAWEVPWEPLNSNCRLSSICAVLQLRTFSTLNYRKFSIF
jgi:hypothetical protein